MHRYTRIFILSSLESETDDFINALPSAHPLMASTSILPKSQPTFRFRNYYRKIIVREADLLFDVFGFAGDAYFDFMVEIGLEGMYGVVFLVDSAQADSIANTQALLDLLRGCNLKVPCWLVELNPAADFEATRQLLGLRADETLTCCSLGDAKSVRSLVLALLQAIPEFADLMAAFRQELDP